MTNRNIRLNNEPFLLRPAAKGYLWGGTRLNDDFAKGINMDPLAETWECSTHPDGVSMVASGTHKGRLLSDVLSDNPSYLGTRSGTGKDLPILVKLIDAKKKLSVQVHPDDVYAMACEKDRRGKNEMWYVLDASKEASLLYGFHHAIDKEKLKNSIEQGTVERHLLRIPVKKDDVFYIPAGKVHAIGAGVLVAEIQENSNLTYRLYDYNRVEKGGKKRELHIEKALDVADLKGNEEPGQPLRVLRYKPGCAAELLCRCKHFEVQRMLVNTERYRKLVEYQADSISFRVLLCIGGCGTFFYGEHEQFPYFKGDCIFFPAESGARIHGRAEFLAISG